MTIAHVPPCHRLSPRPRRHPLQVHTRPWASAPMMAAEFASLESRCRRTAVADHTDHSSAPALLLCLSASLPHDARLSFVRRPYLYESGTMVLVIADSRVLCPPFASAPNTSDIHNNVIHTTLAHSGSHPRLSDAHPPRPARRPLWWNCFHKTIPPQGGQFHHKGGRGGLWTWVHITLVLAE